MEKNVLLAVVLCLATLFIWYRLFPPPAQQSAPQAAAPAKVTPPAAGQGTQQPAPPAAAAATTPAAPAVAVAPPAKEQLTTVERPGLYRAVVSSYGAALQSYELLNPKYFTKDLRRLVLREGASQPEVERRQTDGPTNLITSFRPALGVRSPSSGFQVPEVRQQVWTLVEDAPLGQGGRKLVYRWQSADVLLQKTLEFSGSSYQVAMTVDVKNLRSAATSHHFELGLEGFQDPTQKAGGIFAARVVQNEAAWDRSGKMQSANLETALEKVAADKLRGDLHWVGIAQQYFLLAAAMPHGTQLGEKQGKVSAEVNGSLSVAAEYSEKTLAAGETATYPVVAFAGPKLPELLDDVAVQGQAGGLSTSINYNTLPVLGWVAEPLVRPMLWILRQLHALLNSWALAIVVLTMLVKLVTLYPTHKSMKSMKAMADLRPQIEALKEKCGDNKEKFNLEMMALYKKHGINPLGGCLPMLVQMPVWIALYSMLSSAIELYREPFVTSRWISDLTLADPFFILPLATGVLMYLQTKLSPPPADPQQKMMANMMPVIFTFFSLFLPAGLTLYILTNTVLGMAQQAVINRNKPVLATK
jgi:YidC/Oxa1 family membrane protein insertase